MLVIKLTPGTHLNVNGPAQIYLLPHGRIGVKADKSTAVVRSDAKVRERKAA